MLVKQNKGIQVVWAGSLVCSVEAGMQAAKTTLCVLHSSWLVMTD